MALSCKRPVVRETRSYVFSRGRSKPVVVALIPPGVLELRLKRDKTSYVLDAAAAYWYAVRLHVAAEKKEKQLLRKARREARAK